ncbi:MAG: HAMP domain-containing protein [Candidatus Xenobia bacterium]
MLLHPHPGPRSRQLRWVLPSAVLTVGAVAVVLAIVYVECDHSVQAEFFRAHKTIAHTGQMMLHGLLLGSAALMAFVLGIVLRNLLQAHRIVRPVHTLHEGLDALANGNLGVRVRLHESDEFQEVARSFNRLAEKLAGTLGRAQALAARIPEAKELQEALREFSPGAEQVLDDQK